MMVATHNDPAIITDAIMIAHINNRLDIRDSLYARYRSMLDSNKYTIVDYLDSM